MLTLKLFYNIVLIVIVQLQQSGGCNVFINLDLRSRQPIYLQIVERIKEQIIKEVLKPHEKLPTVRQLAMDVSINPNTIQRAYKELESLNFVYSVTGKGIFVADISDIKSEEKVLKITKDLKKSISEAMFLGVSKERLIELINEVEKEDKK